MSCILYVMYIICRVHYMSCTIYVVYIMCRVIYYLHRSITIGHTMCGVHCTPYIVRWLSFFGIPAQHQSSNMRRYMRKCMRTCMRRCVRRCVRRCMRRCVRRCMIWCMYGCTLYIVQVHY